MDPISALVAALAAGAAAALKPLAETAVKDAYAGLKKLIQSKYSHVSLDVLEKDPSSEPRRAVVKEELERVDAASDERLLQESEKLLDLVKKHDPSVFSATGLDFAKAKIGSLKAKTIRATGSAIAVKAPGLEAQSVDIEDVAVTSEAPNPKP